MTTIMTVDTVKTCSKCGESKALTEYYGDKAKRDGRSSHCKSCVKARRAAYCAANREAVADRNRAYREANREAVAERARAWYASNREAIAEQQRAYRAAHPEAGWAGSYRARAKAHGFDPVVEDFTYTDVVNLYGDACVHCGGDFEHLDHYPIAVSKGGAHSLNNVAPSCAACNRSRGNAEPRQEEALF